MISLFFGALHMHKVNCFFKGSNPRWVAMMDSMGYNKAAEYRFNVKREISWRYRRLAFIECLLYILWVMIYI